MAKFQCERFGEVCTFGSFEDCEAFVQDEGDRSRLWSYIGDAASIYQLRMEQAYDRQMSGDRDFSAPYEP